MSSIETLIGCILASSILALCAGCFDFPEIEEQEGVKSDGNADGDADSDTDGDADTDSDADADGDADSDADGDADADSDVDGDADADGDTDADGDVDGDKDGDADSDSDSDTDADTDNDMNSDADNTCPNTCVVTGQCSSSDGTFVSGYTCPAEIPVCCDLSDTDGDSDSDAVCNMICTSDCVGEGGNPYPGTCPPSQECCAALPCPFTCKATDLALFRGGCPSTEDVTHFEYSCPWSEETTETGAKGNTVVIPASPQACCESAE